MNKRIRDKVLYVLAWIIMVCAGILIQTEETDRLWQLIYRGIYDSTSGAKTGSGYDNGGITCGMGKGMREGRNNENADIEGYVDYWESQVREVCDEGVRSAGRSKNNENNESNKSNKSNESDEGKCDGKDSSADVDSSDKLDANGGITEDNTEDDTKEKYVSTVSAMADISSSYIDMDSDTLLSYCYNATYPKCVKSEELDAENLLSKDMSLDMSTGGYKVLIYHTHSSEAYVDSAEGDAEDTVMGLGQQLADILTDTYGIPVYHDTTEYDMMTGTLDRNASYDYSREGVSAILAEHPEIEVMIDLHRDDVPDDTHLVTEVNGEPTAQIMLINGMCRDEEGNDVDYWSNDNKVDNMALALQTYLAGRGNYGDLMRKIYISTSRYNMDLMPRAMLAEIGAQTNTIQEARNAMEPFAAMLAKVLLE